MIITIDSNIFIKDFWLSSISSKMFLGNFNLIPGRIVISKIVIDEVINKFEESVTERIHKVNTLEKELDRLLNTNKKHENQSEPRLKNAVQNYTEFLNDFIETNSITLLEYPEISHQDVIQRILERTRPFKKGDSGYRDFLIWESIKKLEKWGTEEIVFITNNQRDFGSGLISNEFHGKTTSQDNFFVMNSINEFNEQYIIPKLDKKRVIDFQLSGSDLSFFDFNSWITSNLLEIINDLNGLSHTLFGIESGVYKAIEIQNLHDFDLDIISKEIKSVYLEPNHIEVSFDTKFDLIVECTFDKYDLQFEYDAIKNLFGAFDGSGLLSQMKEHIHCGGLLLFDTKKKKLISWELTFLDTKHMSTDFIGSASGGI